MHFEFRLSTRFVRIVKKFRDETVLLHHYSLTGRLALADESK
jgi:hypothetical protein